jgi:hypothetical protein
VKEEQAVLSLPFSFNVFPARKDRHEHERTNETPSKKTRDEHPSHPSIMPGTSRVPVSLRNLNLSTYKSAAARRNPTLVFNFEL